MITLPEKLHIYVCSNPIDMRRAIDGLCIAIKDHLQSDPQSESLYVFYNNSRDKVKALYWDKNGFVMIYKRLEKGRFQFTRQAST